MASEKNIDTIQDPEPPQYGALHEKADQKPETELVDDTGRRASVAMNIVENPLQVSLFVHHCHPAIIANGLC